MYDIAIIIPCWQRPQRTRRIINQVLNQNINNWEAFIIGDGCSDYQEMIDSGEVDIWVKQAENNGNKLHMFNMDKNYGGCGYKILDYALENIDSKYVVFAGNDDYIAEDHFKYYLSEINNTDLDIVVYPTYVKPHNQIRYPALEFCRIGHSEIIVKNDIIKNYKHDPNYGHDWNLISYLISKTTKIKLSQQEYYTYTVTHIPGINTDIID